MENLNTIQFIANIIGIIVLIIMFGFILFNIRKNDCKQCKKISKKLDSSNPSKRTIASLEKEKELDQALGLVKVKTKISSELYNKAVVKVMEDFDLVEPAAIRYIIEQYELNQWICVEDMDVPVYPDPGSSVSGYSSDRDLYFNVFYGEDKVTGENIWFIVDHEGEHITMPFGLTVTHWRPII